MDLLAKHKKTGAVNRMSEQVFALNGGTDVYDIIDREGSETFTERSQTDKVTKGAETEESFTERMQTISRAAGVIVGPSTVVEEPGKLEAVVAAATNPLNALAVDGPSTSAPTPLQPGVKAVNLADLQNPIGSTMFPNDASPQSTQSARKSQNTPNQDQPQNPTTVNVLKVDDNGTATIVPAKGQPSAPAEKKNETGQ